MPISGSPEGGGNAERDRVGSAAALARERDAKSVEQADDSERRRRNGQHSEVMNAAIQTRNERQRCRFGDILQIGLVARAGAQDQQRDVGENRPRRRADLDRLIGLSGANELNDPLDERPAVEPRPRQHHVHPVQNEQRAESGNDPDQRHDRAGPAKPFVH